MFGIKNHHTAYWLALSGKQLGQSGTAIVQREWGTEVNAEASQEIMRHEAVQLTAVGMAMIEAIDRGEVPVGLVTAKPAEPRQLAIALGVGDEQIDYGKDEPEEYE